MTRRHYINDAVVVQTTTSLSSSATTVPVADASSFPTTPPWTAVIDAGLPTAEVVLVTAATGSSLTVIRGYDGTAAQAHASNAPFAHVAVKQDYDEANDHINSSTNVHGITGAVVGTSDTQELSNKILDSPSVTGLLAVAGSANVSGGVAVGGDVTVTGDISVNDLAVSGVLSGGGVANPGVVLMYGGASAPAGWFLCNGQALNRTTYASLFAVVGTSYGTGDGVATFNVPNLTSTFPRGGTPGATGGTSTHTHTTPAHNHVLSDAGQAKIVVDAPNVAFAANRVGSASWTVDSRIDPGTGATGSTTAQNVTTGSGLIGHTDTTAAGTSGSASSLPPFVGLSFIIKS